MEPKFNIDRPKVSDEEINKHKNFEKLVNQFKEQSINKAKHDKSWWKSKKVRYSAVIAGATVICTVTYLSLFHNQSEKSKTNETLITQNSPLPTKNKNQERKFIAPPSAKLNIAYSKYKVDSRSGGEINHPSSSKIKIPKNAFVDKNGKEIVGEVTIEYREFHDKADIIASGIPMAYDSAGKKYNLESAGMFDIKGSQNGDPVFIRNEIEVELASANPQDRFNQYYLDTLKQNWEYLRRDNLENLEGGSHNLEGGSQKLKTLKKEIEVIIPKKIDSVKVVYSKKTAALPKYKEPLKPRKASGKQTFNIDASTDDFPELKAFGNFVFELGNENKNYTPEMNAITWHDVKISEGPTKGVNYLLTLRYNQRVEKLVVYPVLTGNDYAKAQSEYEKKFENYKAIAGKRINDEKLLLEEMEKKKDAYLKDIAMKKEEYEKLKAKKAVEYQQNLVKELDKNRNNLNNSTFTRRIFNLSKFGVFNSDCPHYAPMVNPIQPIFVTADLKPVFPTDVYVVNHTKNMVGTYQAPSFNTLSFDKNESYSIIVFAGANIYKVEKDEVSQTLIKTQNKFKVSDITEKSGNVADFRKALES
ncbi:MAG: hypothetical protein IPM51_03225 [Sphingobacteriaceae bacterium]|nr:hypothetical protein [Sphingobacteriaceae bacterium]